MEMQQLSVNSRWTLFLDRDGVINRRLPGDYVRRWEDFSFLDGVLEALRSLGQLFGRIVVVTNQQGIGKGLMTEADLALIHRRMLEQVHEAGGRIDAVYYCPDLAGEADSCRKPGPVMAYRARADFPEIEFSRSVMAGDSLSDMAFGCRLGMLSVLIETKAEALQGLEDEPFPYVIDYRFGRLLDLAAFIRRSPR